MSLASTTPNMAPPAAFYARPHFLSDSGRTVGMVDRAGMQKLAEEHEWMRDRIVHLELANALLRSVIETGPRSAVACTEPATA